MVEMMVAIAVIAIAAALAGPNFAAWNARMQLKQAVIDLSTNLSLARMAAMNRNTQVCVTVASPAVGAPITVWFTSPPAPGANACPAGVPRPRLNSLLG